MTTASLLTAAFLIAGVSAGRMIRRVDGPATALVLKTGVYLAAVLAPLQVLIGDQHGLNTLEHQPAKIMALEGHFDSHPDGAPFVLFGFPDQEAAKVHAAIEIPYAGSLLLKHDPSAPLDGLDTVPRENWPPLKPSAARRSRTRAAFSPTCANTTRPRICWKPARAASPPPPRMRSAWPCCARPRPANATA